MSACVVAAQLLDALAMREEGIGFWKRAARLGNPRAQVCPDFLPRAASPSICLLNNCRMLLYDDCLLVCGLHNE